MVKKTSIPTLLLLLTFYFSNTVFAGLVTPADSIPLDPAIRSGVLINGMHYYIRANKLPANRAEFYIAHNVGAIQEEDNQNGLAHFTEHMAFNGTDNFPGKGILNYLETIGVKFGENINAYTSIQSTVYNMSNVPLLRDGIIDTALLILHDWSNYISFVPEEIELERGVINEEWRMYGNADIRMRNELAPVIYKGSKFAVRNVLGDTAVIRHFQYQAIKDFYHDWYRPDNQAVIIVGDFDVDKMEAKVKALFSAIPSVKNPKKKEVYSVPDNADPLIGIAKDKEATRSLIRLYYKHDKTENQDKGLEYMRTDLVDYLASSLLSIRLNEMLRNENPPFIGASSSYSSFAGNKDVFTVSCQPRENEWEKALTAMLTETQRMKRYGFTQGELDRLKANLLRAYESNYNERNNRKNEDLIYPILSNFLDNEPNPGIEYEYSFMKNTLPEISLDELNKVASELITENNIIVTVTGPSKEDIVYPSVDDINKVLVSAGSLIVEPYIDKLASQKLIEKDPTPGQIIKNRKNSTFGTTEWTLSNGMKVIFKSTDFKAEEVLLHGFSIGGVSQVRDEDVITANFISSVVPEMGIGNFSRTDLGKMLAGKKVSSNLSLSSDKDEINGNFSSKDIETELQLVYLAFTNPRWDEKEFNTWLEKTKEKYKNIDADPGKAYGDSVSLMLSDHNKRAKILNYDAVCGLNLEKFKSVYSDRFCDPGNFTFIFTGNINPNDVKPMIEKYLASLPSVKRTETFKDNGIRVPKGKAVNDFKHESTTPRTTVFINYNFKCKYTPNEFILLEAIGNILQLRFTESIREDKGGAYSVYVGAVPRLYPFPMANLQVYFETDPLKADDLIQTVNVEIKKMLDKGPDEADLQKVKEFFLRSRPENLKENGWWSDILTDFYFSGTDKYSGYDAMVNALAVKKLKKYFKSHLTNPDTCEVIMRPLE